MGVPIMSVTEHLTPAPSSRTTALRPSRSDGGDVGKSSVLGLPILMAGSLAFALAAFGGPSEALTPVLVVSGVVGVLAARYAARLGEVRQATIFSLFAGFWLSYSALIVGMTHNWYGIDPDQTGGALAIFLGSWLVVGLAVTVASLSLPAAFSVLLGLFDVALVLLLIAAVTGVGWLFTGAGVAIALFCVLSMYLYLVSAGPSSIGRRLPLGPVLVADE